MDAFPLPEALRTRLFAFQELDAQNLQSPLLEPYWRDPEGLRKPRYYQEVATNRIIEQLLKDERRILINLATGTGKTFIAFQLAWGLIKSGYYAKRLRTAKQAVAAAQKALDREKESQRLALEPLAEEDAELTAALQEGATGKPLLTFPNDHLFPHLRKLDGSPAHAIVRQLFKETPSKMVRDATILQDGELCKQVTVRLHGKGAVLRQEVRGSAIKTKRQYRVRTGQLIYSRIDAHLGAVAIVPDGLNGAVVSTDFPVFDFDLNLVVPRYLRYYTRTAVFLSACDVASSGTTKRTRLKEPDFLKVELPLPPLAEQGRIVAKLDALTARVEQALALQEAAISERKEWRASVMRTCFQSLVDKYGVRPLKGLFSRRRNSFFDSS